MDKFHDLYMTLNAPSSFERRQILIEKMDGLQNSGINCTSCMGVCCSFIANSMKTTPLETLDLLVFLESQNKITSDLIQKLKETIHHYRLDYDIDTGRGTSIRRTYTCPFFTEGVKGCSISRKYKPYGCLGFNAFSPNATEGNKCAPDFDLLKECENKFKDEEEKSNTDLRRILNIQWEKLPMPVALLSFIDQIFCH